VYVFTHDSIAVGEDGPTHQPISHIESLRVIPGLQVLRPADDAETAEAWRLALERTDGPTALLLSRQAVQQVRAEKLDGAVTLEIVATGAEVSLAEGVAEALRADGHGVRVVSALDRSRYHPDPAVARISIEAGSTSGWAGMVDLAIGIDEFGASGPGEDIMAYHGFTVDAVLPRVRECLARAR
jgi:transketolase